MGGAGDRASILCGIPFLGLAGFDEGSVHWGRGSLYPPCPGQVLQKGRQSAGGVVWWEISPEERVSPRGSEVRV